MGYLFLIVISFNHRYSTHIRRLPSFFFTNIIGDANGLVLSWIIPLYSISFICRSISIFCTYGTLYPHWLIGWLPTMRGILWSCVLNGGRPFGSSKTLSYCCITCLSFGGWTTTLSSVESCDSATIIHIYPSVIPLDDLKSLLSFLPVIVWKDPSLVSPCNITHFPSETSPKLLDNQM